MISQHEKQLLQLLDSVLHDKTLPSITSEDWDTLLTEMKEQCVSILPADYLNLLPLDNKQSEVYFGSVGKSIQHYYNLLLEQSEVVSLLQEANIPVAILKGTAAAMNYPHPEYRAMGDIDLIVPHDQFAEAYSVLCSHGYSVEKGDNLQNYIRHIDFSSPNGTEIELHHHFSSSASAVQNKVLDDIIEKFMSDIVTTSISDFSCPVLPPLANGLVLLSHIDHHLGSGLGLRQIIDWMMYVERYLNDDCWNTVFAPAAEATGMKKLAIITTAMCQKYLGLDKSIMWCKIVNAKDVLLCDQLLEHIMKHGNFGRKLDRKDTVSISRLWLLRNPVVFFRTAQQYGQHNWKLLNKYPQLRSFAWLYQIIVWPSHAIKKGFTLKLLLKNRSQEKVESDLLADLKH